MRMIRWLFVGALLGALLAGCGPTALRLPTIPVQGPTSTSAASDLQPVPTAPLSGAPASPAEAYRDRYEVLLWFHDPTPQQGDNVLMFASLLQNGDPMGGDLQMEALYPDVNSPGGVAVHWDRPNYGRGIVSFRVSDQYPVGEPVTITVHMHLNWLGATFTNQISFTPQ